MCNGIFAFVIYDTLQHEIFLFRDQLGIKPLFYYWDGKDLLFGSELKAIKAFPRYSPEIYEPAIGQFLHLGFIPTPFSIYRNVFKLEPGRG
jgi:asparagine synthase (glutamine-hydrolysing)